MGLEWDSVLKFASVGVLVMIGLQVIFFFVFENIGYDSYWLGISLTAFILVFVFLILVWRLIIGKKLIF